MPLFISLMAFDSFFTVACGLVVIIILAGRTPSHLRGRVMATYLLAVLVGNMMMQQIAVQAAKALSIPGMMCLFGAVQAGVAAILFTLSRLPGNRRARSSPRLSPSSPTQ